MSEQIRNDPPNNGVRLLNIPNTLTSMRIVSIGVYLYLFFTERIGAALAVFCAAAATDALDGFIARKTGQITWLGKMLDPVADKLMVIAALVSLALRGWAAWWLIAIVSLKEVLMLVGGAILLRQRVIIQAEPIGKVATAAFLASIVLTFFRQWVSPFDIVMQIASCALTVAALVSYAALAWRRLREADTEQS